MSPRKPINPKKRKGYDGKKIPSFCIKMRERRIELGMTQEDLGKTVGIPKARISEIELGRPPLSHDRISAIADALGVSIDWLFGRRRPTPGEYLLMALNIFNLPDTEMAAFISQFGITESDAKLIRGLPPKRAVAVIAAAMDANNAGYKDENERIIELVEQDENDPTKARIRVGPPKKPPVPAPAPDEDDEDDLIRPATGTPSKE